MRSLPFSFSILLAAAAGQTPAPLPSPDQPLGSITSCPRRIDAALCLAGHARTFASDRVRGAAPRIDARRDAAGSVADALAETVASARRPSRPRGRPSRAQVINGLLKNFYRRFGADVRTFLYLKLHDRSPKGATYEENQRVAIHSHGQDHAEVRRFAARLPNVTSCAVTKRRNAFLLRAARGGRVPEHLSEILANFESGLTSGWLPHRSRGSTSRRATSTSRSPRTARTAGDGLLETIRPETRGASRSISRRCWARSTRSTGAARLSGSTCARRVGNSTW